MPGGVAVGRAHLSERPNASRRAVEHALLVSRQRVVGRLALLLGLDVRVARHDVPQPHGVRQQGRLAIGLDVVEDGLGSVARRRVDGVGARGLERVGLHAPQRRLGGKGRHGMTVKRDEQQPKRSVQVPRAAPVEGSPM